MLRHRNELPDEGRLPAFDGATAWLNGDPLTAEDVLGRVVLVAFGTFTCINWIRSLPHVRAWADTYADQGLLVVGVHTPEFDFERRHEDVRRALEDMDVRFRVAVDNEYAVWRAFDNHYWPALYFADARGRIRHHHFGEGGDEESEMVLQTLLRETGAEVEQGLVALEPSGLEAPADWATLGSPESYVGYERAVGFASPGGAVADRRHVYSAPAAFERNRWSLSGDWSIGPVHARLHEPGGSIAFRFHARDLHLVMGPPAAHPPVRFRVRLDGEPPGRAHGVDVDEQGHGVAGHRRLYGLIRQPSEIGDRTVEVEFLDPDLEAYVFTFG